MTSARGSPFGRRSAGGSCFPPHPSLNSRFRGGRSLNATVPQPWPGQEPRKALSFELLETGTLKGPAPISLLDQAQCPPHTPDGSSFIF